MNTVTPLPGKRFLASPYARRLARDRAVDLANVTGSGPGNRILAGDVLSWRSPVTDPVPLFGPALAIPRLSVLGFSAKVPLAGINELLSNLARVGLEIAVEDVAARAARVALAGLGAGITIELDERQIMLRSGTAMSVGVERSQRLTALAIGADASTEPAAASLLVLHSARVVPVSLPLLPGRILRLVLVVDSGAERGHVLLCADGEAVTVAGAIAAMDAFAAMLEGPLALLA